jgi:predicted DNA-binding transcriptional regulator AlpA
MAASSIQDTIDLIRVRELRQLLGGVSAMWLWRKQREANFPPAIKFGGERSARFWRRADVVQWVEQHMHGTI